MARASFTTPVYFFSSIRAGSGKASIVANLAIFLNNLAQKVALIDLDSETPLKLKNSFPQSINLQTYADLAQVARSEDNRFQKNFYFTETSQISYFPAQKLSEPGVLFADTSLRDFFIQLKASFDCVIINYPAGSQYCQKISELLARGHLWRGSQPVSLIVSQPDEKCVVSLDKLLQQNPAFSYQLQENTCLLFNKVPSSPDEQNLADTTLTTHELRQIFDQQRSYMIPLNDEFPGQRLQAGATVLRSDSLMHQTISGLHRLLSHAGENLLKQLNSRPNDYQACLDGELLEKLTPYLEKIQQAAASRLYVHPSELQVFLEEGPGNFRIRLRISGITQPLLGITTRIRQEPECHITQRSSPESFAQADLSGEQKRVIPAEREALSGISMRPVYKFPDSFSWHPEARLHPQLELLPEKPACPSPILFKPELELPEVPSLSHVLGFSRRQYRKFEFTRLDNHLKTGSVTHFFLPPEFELCYQKNCIFAGDFTATLAIINRAKIAHPTTFKLSYQWPELRNSQAPDFPDAFARTQPLVNEHDFLVRETFPRPADFAISKRKLFSFFLENSIWPVPYLFIPMKTTISFRNAELPRILPLWGVSVGAPPEKQTRDNRFVMQSSSDFDCFSIRVAPANEPYKTLPARTLSLQMQACLFFSTANSDLIWKPAAPILPNTFLKVERDFPAALAFSPTNVEKIEQQISPPDTRLPDSFTWEDLLMEHVYPEVKWLLPDKVYLSDIFKSETPFKPGHPVFFKQDFPENLTTFTASEIQIPAADLRPTYRPLSTALKNVEFKFSIRHTHLAFDLLPVKFNHQKDNAIRDASDQSIYKSDRVIDAGLAVRKFKPVRTSMLQIHQQPSELLNFAARFSSRKLTSSNSKPELAKMIMLSRAPNTSKISKECHLDQLPTNLFTAYRPALAVTPGRGFAANCIRKYQTRPVFAIDSYDLSILSIRRDTQRFHSFPGKDISLTISYKPSIAKRTFKLPSINGNQQVFTISHDQIHIPASLPLRFRHIEVPALNNLTEEKLALRIQRNMNLLCWQKSVLVENIREKAGRTVRHSPRNAPLPARYPLAVSAHRTLRSIPQKKINFFIRFPEPLDVLFEHLRWSLKSARVSGLAFNNSLFKQITDREKIAFSLLQQISLSDQLNFNDRPQFNNRLRQRATREIYPIANLRLRDLMNLARQTNQKFNEVNQKMRA